MDLALMIRRSLAWLTCYALSVGAFVLLTGCASTLKEKADNAAISDGATTLGALALGAAEANPLGLVTVVIKYPVLEYVKTLPQDEQAEFHATASAVWGGATVNNLCVIASILTAGAFSPICLLGGIAYGVYAWNEATPEREFYSACIEYKKVSGGQFRCVYKMSENKF